MTGVGFGPAFDIITAMTMSESAKEFAPKSAMRGEFLALDARMAVRFDRLEARIIRRIWLSFAGFMVGTVVSVAVIVTIAVKVILANS